MSSRRIPPYHFGPFITHAETVFQEYQNGWGGIWLLHLVFIDTNSHHKAQ